MRRFVEQADLRDLCSAMGPRVAGIWDQPIERPVFDLKPQVVIVSVQFIFGAHQITPSPVCQSPTHSPLPEFRDAFSLQRSKK